MHSPASFSTNLSTISCVNQDRSCEKVTVWLNCHPDSLEEYHYHFHQSEGIYQEKPPKLPVDRESARELDRNLEASTTERRKLVDISGNGIMSQSNKRSTRRSPQKKETNNGNSSTQSLPGRQQPSKSNPDIATPGVRPHTPDTALTSTEHDQTPRARPQSISIPPQLSTMVPELQPQSSTDTRSSASSPTRSSSQATVSSRGKRSHSPVKKMGDFRLSDTQIVMKAFGAPGHPIPEAANSLCSDLGRINSGRGIIPKSIEAKVKAWPENGIYDDLPFADMEERVDTHGRPEHDVTWEKVVDIHEAARDCRDKSFPESAWNSEVHSTLLRLALQYYKGKVWYSDITSARIQDSSLLPQTSVGGTITPIQSKMVDYGLVIDPSPLLEQRIDSTLRAEGRPSINPSNAEHIRFTPVAVSIETKRAAIDEDDGYIQLGVWACAHFSRLRQLVGRQSTGNPIQLPVLPIIFTQGHEWKMLLAEMKEVGRIVILRDRPLGSTDTVLGIYKLIAALRRLAEWILEDYQPWFEENALLPMDSE